MRQHAPARGSRANYIALSITVIYLLTNVLLACATVPGANVREAADGQSWFDPSLALLRYRAFVELHHPEIPQTYRQPLFPAFAAVAMWLGGGESPQMIVVAQVIVLLLTGFIVWRIASDWIPAYRNLAFAATILNPNALSTAHLVQSDTLFCLFITGALWGALAWVRHGQKWRHALSIGVCLALACLVRPTAQFLIAAPVVLLPLTAPRLGRGRWVRSVIMGAASAAIGGAILLPWALYLQENGQGFTLAAPEAKYRFVWDQVQMIDAQSNGTSYTSTGPRMEAREGPIGKFIAARGDAWRTLSPVEQASDLTSLGYSQMLDYPLLAHLRTGSRSLAQFLLGTGAGNFHNLLGVGAGDMAQSWFASDQSNPLSVFREFLRIAPPAAITITAIGLAFVVVLRLLDLVGIIALIVRRQWHLFFMLTGLVGYFFLVHVYVGNSRYRLSVDPVLVLLGTYGISVLRETFGSASPRLS